MNKIDKGKKSVIPRLLQLLFVVLSLIYSAPKK